MRMMIQHKSRASSGHGTENPEDVHHTHIEDGTERLLLMWSGNGYTKAETWISAQSDTIRNLEEYR